MQPFIKLHFATAAAALAASMDGTCYRGATYKSGRTKTWIARVAKASPSESRMDAARRIATKNH